MSSWYVKINTLVFQQVFNTSKRDPNIYIKKVGNGNVSLITLLINDLTITWRATKLVEEIKRRLPQEYEMKDLGEMNYFLGVYVWREEGAFDHSKYVYKETNQKFQYEGR